MYVYRPRAGLKNGLRNLSLENIEQYLEMLLLQVKLYVKHHFLVYILLKACKL